MRVTGLVVIQDPLPIGIQVGEERVETWESAITAELNMQSGFFAALTGGA